MKPLNCLIIDDEPLAREGLAGYVNDINFLKLIGTAEDALSADLTEVDLLLLDIEMPKISGIEFLKSLKKPPMVILTTAYPSYALEGYQLDVLDYLLKPITFQRFLKAAQKAREFHALHAKSQPSEEYFFVKVEHKYEKIVLSEIQFVEGMQNYVTIHTTTGSHMTLLTLKSVEERLPPERFMRVHRSYVVAKDKVERMEGNELFIGEARVPVSRGLRDTVVSEIIEKRLWKK